jgi:undecaprenyl-diphosphatase
MLEAILWGLVQGLTEFLPISSSGHLVLVPELLGLEPPDLATSAVLHLGTLVAVLVYFRSEVLAMVRFTAEGKQLLRLLFIGSIPAVVLGLAFESRLETINDTPRLVAGFLMIAGVVFVATRWLPSGNRTMESSSLKDAFLLGLGQALALIPGVSRSGSTISTGLARGFDRAQAARYSFILGIPVIAGAGLLQFLELASEDGGIGIETIVGMVVAAVSGYAAIAFLLRLIRTTGLAPFGVYCVVAGAIAFALV